MKKISHIGIAVNSLDESLEVFKKVLNINPSKKEIVHNEGVETVFFKLGDSKIELVSSFTKENAISKYLSKNSQGIHHICIEVENIEREMKRIINCGIRILNDKPTSGADNRKICFLHPKDTCGVLIELSQNNNLI